MRRPRCGGGRVEQVVAAMNLRYAIRGPRSATPQRQMASGEWRRVFTRAVAPRQSSLHHCLALKRAFMYPSARGSATLPPRYPLAQLPPDLPEECPFELEWRPVAAVMQASAFLNVDELKRTLRRKEVIRTPDMADLVLRLDPAGQLAADVLAAQEAHAAAGGAPEAFV